MSRKAATVRKGSPLSSLSFRMASPKLFMLINYTLTNYVKFTPFCSASKIISILFNMMFNNISPSRLDVTNKKSKILSSVDERICANHIRDEVSYLFGAESSCTSSVEINIVAPAASNSNTPENSMALESFFVQHPHDGLPRWQQLCTGTHRGIRLYGRGILVILPYHLHGKKK